jgi:hypothetical protein
LKKGQKRRNEITKAIKLIASKEERKRKKHVNAITKGTSRRAIFGAIANYHINHIISNVIIGIFAFFAT